MKKNEWMDGDEEKRKKSWRSIWIGFRSRSNWQGGENNHFPTSTLCGTPSSLTLRRSQAYVRVAFSNGYGQVVDDDGTSPSESPHLIPIISRIKGLNHVRRSDDFGAPGPDSFRRSNSTTLLIVQRDHHHVIASFGACFSRRRQECVARMGDASETTVSS